MTEEKIEQKIQDKGLDAPRLTPEHIDGVIKEVYYHRVPNTTLTLCVLTLQNGFQVTGESAAVSLENFDQELGEKIAFQNAREQIWRLEGYLLKQKLFESKKENK